MQLNIFDTSISQPIRNFNPQVLNSASTIAKVSGLRYVPEFITKDKHQELWQAINREPWLTDLKRRVQHYGWKYDYKARSIDYSMFLGELALWVKPYADRLFQSGYLPIAPDQLIINEYQPGHGIANHVDCEPCFGETIISVSLGSNCVMDFINLKTKEKLEVTLLQRSKILDKADTKKIKSSAKKFKLEIILNADGKIVFPNEKKSCKDILFFLNEQYFIGLITGNKYKTNSKRNA